MELILDKPLPKGLGISFIVSALFVCLFVRCICLSVRYFVCLSVGFYVSNSHLIPGIPSDSLSPEYRVSERESY